MKIITSKRLSHKLLGTRQQRSSYIDYAEESLDGMRRGGYPIRVYETTYKTLENEQQNEDGTYSYDYTVRIKTDGIPERVETGEESEYSRRELTEQLIFEYNIHEFRTDLQEEQVSIKAYYLDIDAVSTHEKEHEPNMEIGTPVRRYKGLEYLEFTNRQTKGLFNVSRSNNILSNSEYTNIRFEIKCESINDLNNQVDEAFSKNDYILYLIGGKVKKAYRIVLGLDEIKEGETVNEFLKRISLSKPKAQSIQEAIEKSEITIDDIEKFISENQNINGAEIPDAILDKVFQRNPRLIQNFTERTISQELLRKYNPNFDISKITPSQLITSDLDAVLEQIIKRQSIWDIRGGPSKEEQIEGYFRYLKQFYDNPEALKKIIPVINTAYESDFVRKAKDYISNIPEDVLSQTEIRDVLLETPGLSVEQLLSYKFEYDKQSSVKLLEVLGNAPSKNRLPSGIIIPGTTLSGINSVIEIAKQNNIDDNVILQALRKNGFNIHGHWSEADITIFNGFGITGISVDDVRDTMLQKKNFKFINLVASVDESEMTRVYYSILNELSRKEVKKNGESPIGHNEIFDLIDGYDDSWELLSRLTPEVKQLSKQLLIDNLDVSGKFQGKTVRYYSKLMETMSKSFGLSQEDFTAIYMKFLNNGISQQDALNELKRYIPEEERNAFEEIINRANIYPNPKYFWLTDKNLKRIPLNRGENRGTIKSKIQADGRCFSIRLKTDMIGESKERKKITVNNLSKWLFGVPGAKGNLTITRAGDCIQLPGNTPDEAVKLIESILQERAVGEYLE